MLAVVQHQQQAPGCRASASVAGRGRPGSSRTPTAWATAWGTRAGSARAASSTSHTPSGYCLQGVGRGLEGQAGLARPPGAGQGQQPLGAQQGRHLPQLRSRPTKLVSCRGRLWGSASSVRRGGKSPGRPGAVSWNTRSGRCRSFSRYSPRSSSPAPRRQGVPHQVDRGLGEHHLPPVGRGRQPGAAVQRRPEVVRPLRPPPRRCAAPSAPGARPRPAPPSPPAAGPRCPARAAATASVGRAKAAYTASPTVSNTAPPCPSTAPRSRAWWRRDGVAVGGRVGLEQARCCPPGR